MLNAVPIALRTAARNMVLRHPNSMDGQLYRRAVTRTIAADAGVVGGELTLGGMGVLGADDEAETDYSLLGDCKVQFLGVAEEVSMSDRRDAAESELHNPVRALVEPIVADEFEAKDADLIMVYPGGGVVITYEVLRQIATVNVRPYVTKIELQAQGDLMHIPAVAAAMAARPER